MRLPSRGGGTALGLCTWHSFNIINYLISEHVSSYPISAFPPPALFPSLGGSVHPSSYAPATLLSTILACPPPSSTSPHIRPSPSLKDSLILPPIFFSLLGSQGHGPPRHCLPVLPLPARCPLPAGQSLFLLRPAQRCGAPGLCPAGMHRGSCAQG